MTDLSGRHALVTGGTSGIGRAIVEHLGEVGARVVFTGRNANRGAQVAAASGGRFIQLEASDRQVCDKAFGAALSHLGGRIDLFVANAAMVFAAPLQDTPEHLFREIIEVNLTSTFRLSRAVLETMRANGSGVIVHIVSDAALQAIHHIPVYSIAKAGVLALSETLAAEAAEYGVRVNAICPGATIPGVQATPRGYEDHAEDCSAWGAAPSGRHGTGRDMSQAVVWLASDAASHVNGATIRIDGGASAAMRGKARA